MCCCDCVIYSDLMNDTAGSLRAEWDVVAGTWAYNGTGQATVTSPSVRDRAYVEPPSLATGSWFFGHAVAAELQGEDDGDELGLVLFHNTTGGPSCVYVILKVGTNAAVSAYSWNGTTETLLATARVTAAVGEFHKLRCCETAAGAWMVYFGDALLLTFSGTFTFSIGPRVGGMIARNATGELLWKWLTIKKADTIKCPCSPCTNKDTTDTFTFDFPLYTNDLTSFAVNTGTGRLQMAAGGIGAGAKRTVRCAMRPDFDGLDFSVSAECYFADNHPDQQTGIVVTTDLAFGLPGTIEFWARPTSASVGWQYSYQGNSGGATTGTIAGTTASGDVLAIRVTEASSGAGTNFDIDFMVNGVSKHTVSGLAMDFTKVFYYGARLRAEFLAFEVSVDNVTYDKQV